MLGTESLATYQGRSSLAAYLGRSSLTSYSGHEYITYKTFIWDLEMGGGVGGGSGIGRGSIGVDDCIT